MSATTTQLGLLIARLRGGDADAPAEVFSHIEEAALRNLSECIAEVHSALHTLGPDDPARIPCLKGLAHALCYENRFDEALAMLDEAVGVARRAGRESDLATLELTKVQPLERLGRTADAEDAARAAVRAFETRADAFNAGRAMVNLGVVRRVRGDAGDALAWFDRARPAFRDHALALGTLETNAAEAMLDLDRFEDAAATFARSREIFSEAGHTLGAAIAEGNLADVYSRLGRVDEATLAFANARSLFAASDAHADAARLLAEEAQAYATVGADWRALDLFDTARDALDEPGMRLERVRAMLGEGLALLRIGRHDRALDVLARAVTDAMAADAAHLRDDASLALARALLLVGQIDTARIGLDDLITRFANRPARRAEAMLLQAEVSLRTGDSQHALRLLERCADECSAIAPLRAAHGHARGRTLRALGRLPEAWDQFQAAIALADAVRASLRTEFVRATFVDSLRGLHADALNLALDIGGSHTAHRVFDLVERVRARALADACAGRRDAARPSCDSDEIAAIARALTVAYAELSRATTSPEANFATLHARIRDLESRLERSTQVQFARETSLDALAPMSLSQAQHALEAGHAAMVWFRSGDTLGALVIHRMDVHILPSILTVREAATLSRRQVMAVDFATRSPDASRDNPAYQHLCRVLQRHVAPALAGITHVAIVACPEVFGLPLAPALAAATPQAEASLTTFLAPSMTSAVVIARRHAAHAVSDSRTASSRALVVGVSDAAAPRMEHEARAVASEYARATVLVGTAATADAFLTELAGHEVIHIASHCEFDPQFPMASRIKLADRWVAARELFTALRPGCVVVLAGCESGRTSDTIGEDRQGLVRALLVGGASMVIASQWRLHDQTAATIFPLLHRAFLLERDQLHSPAAAMAAALAQTQREAEHVPWHSWQGLFAMGGLL
jgi:tetratricopeptide (TPR) repeat protein